MPRRRAASMRFVPASTSISLPSIVSFGTHSAPAQRLERRAELLDVGDVGADGAVVEGADRGAATALGNVEDGVEIVLAAVALDDAVDLLVDPAGGLAARRALPARLVGVEARQHHEGLGDRDALVHDDDAGRADHRARVLETVDVHRDVDLVGGPD